MPPKSKQPNEKSSLTLEEEYLRLKAQAEVNAREPATPKDILGLSQILENLFTIINPKLFKINNYLEHANKIVQTFSQLYTALNSYDWNSADIKNKLNHELNNIYEILEDHGWQCDSAPRGLIPASAEGLARFIGGLIGEKTELSEFIKPLESAQAIWEICQNELKANRSISSSQAHNYNSSVLAEHNDLSKLIEKIKNSAPLFRDPLIIGNPLVANQISKYESKLDNLGFTTIFYAAKYSENKDSIACLLHHCTNAKMKLITLQATLKNSNNPYFGARALMISAQFGTTASLNEILDSISDAEKTNHVNYAISRKGSYVGWTALHFACKAEFSNSMELKAQLAKVTALLNQKADINAASKANPRQTPLSLALSTSNNALFHFLIKNGVSLDVDADYFISLIRESTLSMEEKNEVCRTLDISLKACLLKKPLSPSEKRALSPETNNTEETAAKRAKFESPSNVPAAAAASSSSFAQAQQSTPTNAMMMQTLAEEHRLLHKQQQDFLIQKQKHAFFLHAQYLLQKLSEAQQSVIRLSQSVNEAAKQELTQKEQELSMARIAYNSSVERTKNPQPYIIKNTSGIFDIATHCNCTKPDCLQGLYNRQVATANNGNSFFNRQQPSSAMQLDNRNEELSPSTISRELK